MIYEITYISKDENDSVKKIIESAEGKIIFNKSLGRKKFVYPIKHETAGFYTTIVFELDGQKLSQLDKELRMNQEILRYLTISYQKEFSPAQIEKKLKEFKEPKQKELQPKSRDIVEIKKEIPIARIETDQLESDKVTDKKESKPAEKEQIEKIEKPKIAEKPVEIKKEPEKVTEQIEKPQEEVRKEEVDTKVEEKEVKKEAVILPKPKKEAVSEEERLAKLEEKLDELLKD